MAIFEYFLMQTFEIVCTENFQKLFTNLATKMSFGLLILGEERYDWQ
ncbi:hypothetical protein LV89_02069 [Arcicella aurantiaca]|uniref:Uncharacterized protein n=1 Tax=Arcicella aurantiaca TaxID=591202 RepID=A0A316EA42_9BACT|nr:hypothetical protein LV89_02069 [Arcicella aurantiaca]